MTTNTPLQVSQAARELHWYKPTDHPQDSEDALWMAHGIGGRYSIQADLDKFIVWLADDEFRFIACESVDACKATAEAHWQEAFAKHLRSPKEHGEANCWVPASLTRSGEREPAPSRERERQAFYAGWKANGDAHDYEGFAPHPPTKCGDAYELYASSLTDRNLVASTTQEPALDLHTEGEAK